MTLEAAATRGVNNYYGVRTTDEQRSSNQWVGGNMYSVEVAFRGNAIALSSFVKLPKGALVTSVTLEVLEAFALAGTSPVVNLGTDGSAATNGAPITEAKIEAIGLYKLTPQGTWAGTAPLAAETTIDIELSGTSPVLTANTGHAVIKVNYELVGA